MAAALSGGSPAAFLAPVDPEMPGYAQLRANVYALLDQADVASSIRLLEDEGDEQKREVALDWVLEIRSKQASGPLERRRQNVKARLERRRGEWKLVSLEPISLFAAPAVRPRAAR